MFLSPMPQTVRAGAIAFLKGEAIPEEIAHPAKHQDKQWKCDFRMGWHTAKIQRERHPDWTDEYILI